MGSSGRWQSGGRTGPEGRMGVWGYLWSGLRKAYLESRGQQGEGPRPELGAEL